MRAPGWYRVRDFLIGHTLQEWFPERAPYGWYTHNVDKWRTDEHWAEIDERPIPVDRHPLDLAIEAARQRIAELEAVVRALGECKFCNPGVDQRDCHACYGTGLQPNAQRALGLKGEGR